MWFECRPLQERPFGFCLAFLLSFEGRASYVLHKELLFMDNIPVHSIDLFVIEQPPPPPLFLENWVVNFNFI